LIATPWVMRHARDRKILEPESHSSVVTARWASLEEDLSLVGRVAHSTEWAD
jgi:hypothetical protein